MIEYDLLIGLGAVVEAWLVALVLLRGGRPWLQATFAALGLTLIVNAAAFVGTDTGFLSTTWQLAMFATLVLAYPLAAILVLGLIHGESLPRRKSIIFLLLAPVPLFVLAVPSSGWTAQYAYDLNPLGGFLGVCLAIPLAESIYQKMMSNLYSRDAEWLIFAVLVLIVGGPVYTIEFDAMGLPLAAGATLVAPVALTAFAVLALRTAPYPAAIRRRARRWSGEEGLGCGHAFAFQERRPAYALEELRREASDGRPCLLIARASLPPSPDLRGLAVALVEPSRHAASRVMTTASEFLARFPGGLVGLLDLGDVALMSGWKPTREMLGRLRNVARGTAGAVLLATACLTPPELDDVKKMTLTWWTLPDPAEEIEAVLGRSFGPGARQLLALFARTRGLRPADLTLEDVPALVDFMGRAILEPGAAVADPAAIKALRSQTESAVADLRGFVLRSPAELAQGDWPSKTAALSEGDLVVTADEFWKGREMGELVASATQLADRQSLFERALAIFVEYLGPAGEGMLRSEVAKLGRRPQELRAQDVARLADRAAVDLSAMADVVDVPQEKIRIRTQIESIRRRLEAIAGVDS